MNLKKLLISLSLISLTALPAWAEKKISVLPFEVLTKREDLMQFGIGTMDSLTTALSNIPDFVMVDRGQLNTILKEQAFQKSAFSDDKETTEIGKLVGADILVMGSIQAFDNEFRINAHFTDVKTGKILKTVLVTGNNIFKLQDQLASELINQQEIKISTEQKQLIKNVIQATDNTTAYDYYIKGQSSALNYNIEGYKSAIVLFDKALEVDPNYTLALAAKSETQSTLVGEYLLSGMEYKDLLKQAKDNANLAFSKDPKLGDVHRALSHIYSSEGNTIASKREAEKALEINPNDAKAIMMTFMTNYFKNLSKFDLNVNDELLVKALKINPNLLDAHMFLAIGYMVKGNYDKSIEEATICTKIAPLSSYAHLILAGSLIIKDKNEALKEYLKSLELNPNNSIALTSLGSLYSQMERYDEAIVKYNESLNLYPDKASTYFELSNVYQKKAQYPEAEVSLKKAMSLSTIFNNNINIHYSLGQTLLKNGKNEEALNEFKTALKLSPDKTKNHNYLGLIYELENNFSGAITEFKQLENYEYNKEIKIHLANCYLNLSTKMFQDGKVDESILNYIEAKKFNPNNIDIHINLGVAYYTKKNFVQAISEYLQAIKLKPDNANAHYNLGIAYDALQKKNLANAEYSSACKLGIKSACN